MMTPLTLGLLSVLAALIQPASQPAPQPTPPPSTQPEPTLDELLGIKKPETPKPEGESPRDADLDRALSPGQVAAGFQAAVELMSEAALRLERKDAGIDTQRVQEDVLRKLDQLIADARRQQSKSKSSSSKQNQGQPDGQQQQQGAQSQQQQQAAQGEGSGENRGDGPARVDGTLKPALPGSSAAWGNLPAHVRDALMQGWSDRFSSVYRGMTEEYYKRLAEQQAGPERPR
ncbi:MAG: hypothetical protein HUU18_00255 [Phycisphaerales bacterium]|nr:hypothetical protein [Phycisphaerales bacterium]